MINPKVIIVIPARYGSSRLPGKPLLDIHGKSMIHHVYEQVSLVRGVSEILIATDNSEIYEEVLSFGGMPIMTSIHHQSGTDRLVEVSKSHRADIYINIQGDEPLVDPLNIEKLIDLMHVDEVLVGTLHQEINDIEASDPNNVKMVLSGSQVLYFSRAKIPFKRDENSIIPIFFKHIGVYGYKRSVLEHFSDLPMSCLEEIEKLEQLRFLENSISIHSSKVDFAFPGVDTYEGLEYVRSLLTNKD
jgi:3-deoxy-D-manno-octulosonate cytidylyltransferase